MFSQYGGGDEYEYRKEDFARMFPNDGYDYEQHLRVIGGGM